ncbi:hypothetical protein COCON_G00167410 [Conger conger]|uniref:Uncharacterized protein n=1 Tax=Conger conger TaxID=82655 RepID=A0A9Q1HU36_CONCO|nr:hypothetical protein COCON_G00167410 [Conger conger]
MPSFRIQTQVQQLHTIWAGSDTSTRCWWRQREDFVEYVNPPLTPPQMTALIWRSARSPRLSRRPHPQTTPHCRVSAATTCSL